MTIKDLPPRLHRELKSRAEANGRSLNTEVIACLLSCVQSARVDVESLLQDARSVRNAVRIRLTTRDFETGSGRVRA